MNAQIDDKVPFELLHTQVWFGEIIARPLNEDESMQKITSNGNQLEEEINLWISPSKYLTSKDRLQIYSQLYWRRLIKAISDLYPTLVRFFGYEQFKKKIAIPFLSDQPPNHWWLRFLGKDLPGWVKENYQESDKELIYTFAKIDWSIEKAFHELSYDLDLTDEKMALILSLPIKLQPHVTLFCHSCDVMGFRVEFLKEEVIYWQSHPFPQLSNERPFYHIVYRNPANVIFSKEISEAEYIFLNFFLEKTTIEEVCCRIEDLPIYPIVEEQLSHWLQDYFSQKIFYLS